MNSEGETALQVQYAPRSRASFAVGTLVPKNMQTSMSNTRGKLEPTLSIEDFVNSYRTTQKWRMNNNTNTRTRDHVELYEIHDRKTGKIKVIARGHDKFLRNENNALQIDNVLPFTSMTFTPTTRAFWTTPDVFYLYHVQNELSDVARQRTKQRRISTLKFLYNEDVISEAEL